MPNKPLLILLMLYSFVASSQEITFQLAGIPENNTLLVGIRGNTPPLSWYTTTLLKKTVTGGYQLRLPFAVQQATELEFKFVLDPSQAEDQVQWENFPNRKLLLAPQTDTVYRAVFNQEPYLDPASLPVLSPTELEEDLAILQQLVEQIHPGTFRYQNKAEVTQQFADARQLFSRPQTNVTAFLTFTSIMARVQCDHTIVKPPYLSSVLYQQANKLPFTFRWYDKRMIVTSDASPEYLFPPGTEILTLNGQTASGIYAELYPLVPADGPAAPPRAAKLSVNGYPFEPDGFDLWYYLMHPPQEHQHVITYQTNSSSPVQKATIAGISASERLRILTERNPATPLTADDLWNFTVLNDSTALLTLGSFVANGPASLQLEVATFFAEAFGQIAEQNISHLIIDVRENTGGNDPIVGELLTYFPFKYPKQSGFVGKKRYETMPTTLADLIVNQYGQGILVEKGGKYNPATGYYTFPKAFLNYYKNRVKNNAFRGKTYWLTGRQNASLGFYLAKAVREYQLGTLIGETTAGSQQGINGGASFSLRLPNSGVEVQLPVMGSFAIEDKTAEGIVPDYLARPTLESIRAGEDVALTKALNLIQKR